LPILNGIPEVDAAVKRGKFKTIGIIGTRTVMATRLYGAISSAAVVVLLAAGEHLCREQGAEVVLLGGTDLFLAFQGHDAGFPVLDCAEVHVEAIYQASLRTT
jgi:aspartate racemase